MNNKILVIFGLEEYRFFNENLIRSFLGVILYVSISHDPTPMKILRKMNVRKKTEGETGSLERKKSKSSAPISQ